jgi:N4-(beta-N-acetylglucosaminyl)-L-asparaginase
MILVANSEGFPGIGLAAEQLASEANGLDAIVDGISLVEKSLEVRSVGFGGWPNIIGEMEFDAGVMDGDSLESGAVGALTGVIPAVQVAKLVKEKSNHQVLVGLGAKRFAEEMGYFEEETLYKESRETWRSVIAGALGEDDAKRFPHINLAAMPSLVTDPEKLRDTTVFLCRDARQSMYAATSTSGQAWKYPGRLGDSPLCGAGFYADSRFGAVACTHTGEMTIRQGTAKTVVTALRLGYSLDDALGIAISDLADLKTGHLGGVVVHAIDKNDQHKVVSFRCEKDIEYWFWSPDLAKPELRKADVADR